MRKGSVVHQALVCCVVMWAHLTHAAAQVETDQVPSIKVERPSQEELAKLRKQLFQFAPYASMHSRFGYAAGSPSSAALILTDWTELRTLDENIFDTRVALQTAYRDLRAFMVRTEASALPMLQKLQLPAPMIDPFEQPELALVEVLFLMSAEYGRNAALSAWARDHDATCRAAFARIVPLMREVVDDSLIEGEAVRLRHWFLEGHGVYLEAINDSGRELTNVTLSVKLSTLDRSSSDHYYFIPLWPAEEPGSQQHRYPLRIASDWREVGAAATTRATLEVISDQYSSRPRLVRFDDHIPNAADRVLDQQAKDLSAGRHFATIIAALRSLDDHLGQYPDRLARSRELRALAQEQLDRKTDPLEKEIKGLREKLAEVQAKRGRWKDVKPEARSSEMEKLRGEIKKRQDQVNEWKSGKR